MKKNNCYSHRLSRPSGRRSHRIIVMKLASLLLLVCGMQITAGAYSQEAKMDLKMDKSTLSKALKKISKQTDYRFIYNNDLLPKEKNVTITADNESVSEILKKILLPSGLNWELLEEHLIAIGYQLQAEEGQPLTGTVTDDLGNPLVGVTIQIKGSATGTVTDENGKFSLEVPEDAVLIASFLGYKTKEVPVNEDYSPSIILSSTASGLDEVVVVGYGTQKKSDLTGAVSSVNMEKAEAIPTTNIAEMLRGQASGVQVQQMDNRPGGNSNIMIRGTRSILGGNAPLFVVDGVPVEDINDINAEDIASIEVLKDASAQAIYGSRASNGVILVTTKRGYEGKVDVQYHGYYTTQKLVKNFDLYSAEEFAQLRREAYRATNFIHDNEDRYSGDDVIFNEFERESLEEKRFVNWEDLIKRNARLMSHNLSLRGGNEDSKFYSSIRYFDQDGVIPTSGYNRGTLRLNFDQKISDKINVQVGLQAMTEVQDIESSSLGFITMSPLAKPFNEDGSLNKFPLGPSTTTVNPLWNIHESKNQAKKNGYRLNLAGNYELLNNLSYRLNTSISRSNTDHGIYLTSKHSSGANTNGKATINNSTRSEFLIENIINYNFDLGESTSNHFDITAMQSVNQIDYIHTQAIGTDFSTDALGFNGLSGAKNFEDEREGYKRRLLSYMGRVRYTLNDKYLVTLTGRSDGSSVFAQNKKRGFFPSAAVAWKIDQEPFLRDSRNIDQLKLRFSYGSVGNEAIDPYQTLGIADNFPYVFGGMTASGFMPGERLPNPNLTWETSTTFNAGIDFSFVQGLLVGTIGYYNTHTRDLLVDVTLPGNTGFSSTITNGGKSENSGIEANLTAHIISKNDFQWSVTANYSRNRNKILQSGIVDDNGNPKDDIARNRFIGQPINVIYQKKFDGIFQDQKEIDASAQKEQNNIIPGDVRVIDKNGDGQIDDDDNFIFRRDPSWFGALSTNLRFRDFELLADLYIVEGALNANPYLSVYENGGTLQGSLNGIKVPYWTPEQPSENYPRPQSETQSYLTALSVQDASYVRLRTLTLAYHLPDPFLKKIGFNQFKIYFTGTNLFTVTKYKSYSPEINPDGFPDAKAFTFGLQLSL